MLLTSTAIRNLKPKPKQYMKPDGQGLWLFVMPNGKKYWRFNYRFSGKRNIISFGVYPEVSLAQAREKREETRKLIANGTDPSKARKDEKAKRDGANTFEAVAREWIENNKGAWAERHTESLTKRLERNVFPSLGKRPVSEIDAQELLRVLREIEGRGVIETAHRCKQVCGQVFRYAVATGRASHDPSTSLRGALKPVKSVNFAAITEPDQIAGLLLAIDGYQGSIVVVSALRLAPLVFVRPGELRHAEWSEINLDGAMWTIPGGKMKGNRDHMVPLSRQAVEILRGLHSYTGSGRYVFPSIRTSARAISENTVNAALRKLGYSTEEMTGHGFRSMASTRLNEQGYEGDHIEMQLAHVERSKVRGAYNRAKYLPQRIRMMQDWADYLDTLKAGGGKLIPLRKSGEA